MDDEILDKLVLDKLMEDRRRYLSLDWLVKVAMTRDTELRCHRIALTYSQYAAYLDLWLFQKESYWFRQYKAEPTSDLEAAHQRQLVPLLDVGCADSEPQHRKHRRTPAVRRLAERGTPNDRALRSTGAH